MHITEKELQHQTIRSIAGRTSPSSACRRGMRGKAREDWLFSVPDLKKCNFFLYFTKEIHVYISLLILACCIEWLCTLGTYSATITHISQPSPYSSRYKVAMKNKNKKKSAKKHCPGQLHAEKLKLLGRSRKISTVLTTASDDLKSPVLHQTEGKLEERNFLLPGTSPEAGNFLDCISIIFDSHDWVWSWVCQTESLMPNWIHTAGPHLPAEH